MKNSNEKVTEISILLFSYMKLNLQSKKTTGKIEILKYYSAMRLNFKSNIK